MTPTLYFRWYAYSMGNNGWHPSAMQTGDGRHAQVLQQWWHRSDEPPPSSFGEWRDVPIEGPT